MNVVAEKRDAMVNVLLAGENGREMGGIGYHAPHRGGPRSAEGDIFGCTPSFY